MARSIRTSAWTRAFKRSLASMTRKTTRASTRALTQSLKPAVTRRRVPTGTGGWISGVAMGAAGARRFWLFRPADLKFGERLPLLVMLHGCGQDAKGFALSTRMNSIAARERFFVLYPQQDRLANPQGCWNWFDTRSGRAHGEAALIMKAVDQVCLLYPVDRAQVAVAGFSAGASMAALLATRYPGRFKAVVMHSGIPPGTANSALSALGAMQGRRVTAPLAGAVLPIGAALPPLMVIHGGADRVVAVSNGQAAVAIWASAAGAAAGQGRAVQRGKRYPAQLVDFKRKGTTVATLMQIDDLGHAWSGGAARQPYGDAQGPDASRAAWAFVARQFEG